MYITYILKSAKTGKYYYGSSIDVERRLKKHNAGKVISTRNARPWVIHYIEEHPGKTGAIKRELFFKKRSGHKWLKEQAII
jgi:putative endonuclease